VFYWKKKRHTLWRYIILEVVFIATLFGAGDIQPVSFLDDHDPVASNSEVVYSVQLKNNKGESAEDVELNITVPDGFRFLRVNESECSYTGDDPSDSNESDLVECNFGDFDGSEAREINVTLLAPTLDNPTVFESNASSDCSDDDNPANNYEITKTTVVRGSDLNVTKTSIPNPAIASGIVTYEMNVSNNGPHTATSVTLKDTLPDVLTFYGDDASPSSDDDSKWECSASGQEVTCVGGDLEKDEAQSFHFRVKITGAEVGTITNATTVSSEVAEVNSSDNTDTDDLEILEGTDIGVVKRVLTNPVIEDENVTFELNVSNLGQHPAEGIVLEDILNDTGYEVLDVNASGWSCDTNENNVTCQKDENLSAKESSILRITAKAPEIEEEQARSDENNVSVTMDTADPIEENDKDSVLYTVWADQADLELWKSKSPTPLAVGDIATSTIRVKNHGPREADPVQVVDVLDENESYDSFEGEDWDCSESDGNVTCDYAKSLAMGEQAPLLYIKTKILADDENISNRACTGGSGGSDEPDNKDTFTENDCAEAGISGTDRDVRGVADIQVIKESDDDTITPDEESFTYTINIKNIEGNTSKDVVFKDRIPQYIEAYEGREATGLSLSSEEIDVDEKCSIDDGTVECSLGDMDEGDEINISIKVSRPMQDDTRTNTASAYSTEIGDTNRTNNQDSATVTVENVAEIEMVSKIVTPDEVLAGTEATYTLTIRNNGPSLAEDVNVSDLFSGESFTFLSATSSKGECADFDTSNRELNCSLGDMSYGEVESITIKIRPDHLIPSPEPWDINNTARVRMATPDGNVSNNEKNVTLKVKEGEIDLSIEVDESGEFQEPVGFDPEDESKNIIVYKVNITNNGPSYATDVNFSAVVNSVSPDNEQNLTFEYVTANADGSEDDESYDCTFSDDNTTFRPTADAPSLLCSIGDMASESSYVRYLVYTIEDAPHYVSGDVYHIDSNVTAREKETLAGNNEEDEKTTVRVFTDPSIEKRVSQERVEVGEVFEYALHILNRGPGYSPTTVVKDSLPDGMVIVDDPTITQGHCNLSEDNTSVTCYVDESDGTLHSTYLSEDENNESNITLRVMFTEYPLGGGELNTTVRNVATVSTSGPDKNESNNDAGVDVMVMKPAHIGDRVWLDRDADGKQESEEIGIEGVEVYLILESSGDVVQTTTTDSEGLYGFDVNHSDEYRVEFNLTDINGDHYDEGEIFVTEQNSTDDDEDSDINISGSTEVFTIEYGDNNRTIDAGLYRYVNIGNRVWLDENGNGIQDDGEANVSDVNVTLYLEDGTQVTEDIDGNEIGESGIIRTDSEGSYLFRRLKPNTYYVVFDKASLPQGYVFTTEKADDSTYADDSNADRETGETFKKTVLADKDIDDIYTYRHFDAGIYEPVSIGDYVWVDEDGDGEQNSSEQNLSDVNITLMDAGCSEAIEADQNESDAFVNPLQSDENGSYLFSNLKPDTYCLKFTAPDGSDYVMTQQHQGEDENNDSDPDGFNTPEGSTDDYILTSGEDNLSVDAGFYLQIHIGDHVWEDKNYNGIQESDEKNVSDIRVYLIVDGVLQDGSDDTEEIYQDTNESGEYLFSDLPPAHTYSVRFTNLPEGYRFTQQDVGDDDSLDSDANATGYASGETPRSASDDENLTFDAGIYKPIVIGDRVWEDTDANGLQDSYDWNLSGVVATIVIDDEVYDEINTTTDENGTYLFDIDRDLKPNHRYAVKFSHLPQTDRPYLVTLKDSGDDDTLDSDINETNITTSTPIMYSGESNLTLDGGFYRLGLVGDRVWYDENGDGNQTSGEEGVADVNVTLWDASDDTQVKKDAYGNSFGDEGTLSTDDKGVYHFDNVMPGKSYYVLFESKSLPQGYTFTQLDEGDNDYVDSDANRTTGKTRSVYVYSDANRTWMDAGIYKPVSIGDHTWLDANGDGLQGEDESNLSDVNITLMDAGCNHTITSDQNGSDAFVNPLQSDENGSYLFSNLKPDTYCLKFTAPDGSDYVMTQQHQGEDENNDSDADGFMQSEGSTDDYILTSGEENLSVDAGLFEPVSVGDYVWIDENDNGIQDEGERNVSDMNVTLYRDGDWQTPLQRVRTDENGSYRFEGLPAGHTYGVDFNLSYYNDEHNTHYHLTREDSGDDDTLDSDANRTTTQTEETPLMYSGDSNMSLDAGVYEPIEIGDYVWHDTNGDGVQDDDEEGLEDVLVTLVIDGELHTDINTTTQSDGSYLFDESYDLKPGHQYSIEVTRPDDTWYFTQANAQTGDDSNDSDVDSEGKGVEQTPVMHSGDSNRTLDAGLFHLASVGDTIWLDSNLDGVQDDDESAVSGLDVNVTLYNGEGEEVASQVVSDGAYRFEDLDPDSYTLSFSVPNNYAITTQDATDDDKDSDVNRSTAHTAPFLLASGQEDLTRDMGLYEYASLGDRIWLDSNANGIQDEGEENISGVDVNVTLYTEAGDEVDSVVVNDGSYLFEKIVPDSYYLHFTLPDGYTLSPQNRGDDSTEDSDVNVTTQETPKITLASGENNLTWDMGLYEGVRIGDRIWLDSNANGIQDEGEENLSEEVTVKLLDDENNTVESQTVDNGAYLFDDITPGTYHLHFSLPDGYVIAPYESEEAEDSNNSDVNVTTQETKARTYLSGDEDMKIDMGLYEPASIGDRIWLDSNANGIQDEGEENLTKEVSVYLEDENNQSVKDVNGKSVEKNTTTNGYYRFDNLVPAVYHLRFEFPDGMKLSPKDEGDDAKDSDVNSESNTTENTTLISGEEDFSWDMGLYENATIGDLIWIDVNANGIQDDETQRLEENITVILYDSDDNEIASTIVEAGSEGNYSFTNLTPDDYYVKFQLEENSHYLFVTPFVGDDEEKDSDVNVTTAKTPLESISSDEVNTTFDAGIYIPATLGDRVWLDGNANGIQDAGEANLSDMNVTLYNEENETVAITRTDENGTYLFEGLTPATYHLLFTLEDDDGLLYEVSPQGVRTQGTEENNDSDINASGQTADETLVSGEVNREYDAGLYLLVNIGDRVWSDANANGIQESGEEGLSDVNVSLYRVEEDGTHTYMASQETNSSGNYLFSHLVPATYYVKVDKPKHYQTTPPFVGEDETIDSNIDPQSGESEAFALRSPENNMSLDAGFYALATITGSVFEDTTNDSQGDSPLEGVKLYLVDASGERVAETTTLSDGSYLFEDVEPNDYTIEEVQPAQMVSVSENEGGGDDDAGDESLNNIIAVSVGVGERDSENDFVEALGVSLGDRVWFDENGDGIQQSSEKNSTDLEGIEVSLYAHGERMASTTTDENGYYLFENYPSDTYVVAFNLTTLPKHYAVTQQYATSDESNDSDVNATTYATRNQERVETAPLYLDLGEHNLTLDMGIYKMGAILGAVYGDINGDNRVDGADDHPLEGVEISLLDAQGNLLATTHTRSDGTYSFEDVPQGSYIVKETQPSGYLDINATGGEGESEEANLIKVNIEAGEEDSNNNFNDKLSGRIGDYVWHDNGEAGRYHEANGIQDADENGTNGVRVCLEDTEGNPIVVSEENQTQRCTTTDGTGYYEFVGLMPAEYVVVFAIPEGTALTPYPQEGSDSTKDSNPIETMIQEGGVLDGLEVAKADVTLEAGEQDDTIDMGLVYACTGKIGDYVWIDSNKNGLFDTGEKGLDGVIVRLYNDQGVLKEEYVTHDGGYYIFEHLCAGEYVVEFILPRDWGFVESNVLDQSDARDSDANPYTGRTLSITLSEGEHQRTWDAGVYCECEASANKHDSGASLNPLWVLLLTLSTLLIAFFFLRREADILPRNQQ